MKNVPLQGIKWKMRHNALSFVMVVLTCVVYAAPEFPNLSGRVVDDANMLGSTIQQKIIQQLQAHEKATGNQVVVVTVPDLGGYDIESYGFQLGRAWGVGQKGEDNGALLIIAQKERKVRIEVGYGLEDQLTDAISSNIIHTIIVPSFKLGKFEDGIAGGVTAMIQALGGEYQIKEQRRGGSSLVGIFHLGMILILIFTGFIGNLGRGFGFSRRGGFYGSSGYRSGGGFSGGGFSGGGGSFGGGGASGGW